VRFLRCAAAGFLFSLAFPTVDAWYLAYLAMVPLVVELELLVRRAAAGKPRAVRAGFGAVFAFGLGLYVPLLWWIVLLDAPALTLPWIRYPAPFAIALVEAAVLGLAGAAHVFVRSRLPVPAAILFPALWCTGEWVRGSGELGFPWGVLGYSQVPFLPTLQLASVAGLTGLTFGIVAVNALLAGAVLERRGRWVRSAGAVALVVAAALWGSTRLDDPNDGPTVRAALVQPSVLSRDKWQPENREAIFEAMAELSRQGAARGAELVVWPETAAPCYLLKDQTWRPFVEDLTTELGVPLFVGLPDYQVRHGASGHRVTYTNTGAYFRPDRGLDQRMDKIQLVPFGEHVPYSRFVPLLDRIDFGEADFVPGDGPVLFALGDARFGNLVCFEAIFPHLTRRYENEGADLLVNITNDSWFGAGAGAISHKNMAVVRCVETGCGMARCANSGISVGVDSRGRTFGETDLFVRTVSVVDVPLRQGRTVFARFGDWVGLLSRSLAGLALIGAVARGRQTR